MKKDALLSIILTAIGGLALLMGGIDQQSGFLIGIGIAFTIGSLLALTQKPGMTGGWAGAAIMGPTALMAYVSSSFILSYDCVAFTQQTQGGNFFFLTITLIPFAWISSYLFGKSTSLRFPFPIEFPIFLGLIGIFASLLSPIFMDCDEGTKTILLSFVSAYLVGWSGLSLGVRNYTSEDNLG